MTPLRPIATLSKGAPMNITGKLLSVIVSTLALFLFAAACGRDTPAVVEEPVEDTTVSQVEETVPADTPEPPTPEPPTPEPTERRPRRIPPTGRAAPATSPWRPS